MTPGTDMDGGYPFSPLNGRAWEAGKELDVNQDMRWGMITSEGPEGVPPEEAALTPWFVTKVDTNDVTVYPATVTGYGTTVMPTIGGDDLDDDPPPELTISGLGTGTKYVYAKIELTPSFDADGTLEDATLDAVSVLGGATIPTDSVSTGIYYRHIATFVDGEKTAQVMNYSLDVVLLNKGSFASEAWLVAMASG